MQLWATMLAVLMAATGTVATRVEDHECMELAVEMGPLDAAEVELTLARFDVRVVRKLHKLGGVFHLEHGYECGQQQKAGFSRRHYLAGKEDIRDVLMRHPLVRRVERQEDLEVEQKKLTEDMTEFFYDDRTVVDDTGQQRIWEALEKEETPGDMDEIVELAKRQDLKEQHLEERTAENGRSREERRYKEMVRERKRNLSDVTFNDPEAGNLWQYNNEGQFSGVNPGFDMNLFRVYKANITGRGIVVTVIDDGLDSQHREIAPNFDPVASLDLNDPSNSLADPRGPSYRHSMPLVEGHGTSCASVIAGVANNGFCAFGVAFNANIGGIRMLSRNMVTDLLEAYALTHNQDYVDIYSNSWGPKDSGYKTAPVTYYVKKALRLGVEKGRRGRGSLFLFAAGNGGLNHDHCGADGLVNSPHTFAVTAVNIYGRKPAYTEECAAISVTAAVGGYSYSDIYQRRTIDPVLIAAQVNNHCVKRFLGTSAATPIIAGCIALALEANALLSWRDVQHLFAVSCRIPNPRENVWQVNGAGNLVSHYFGPGLLDCGAFTRNAQLWHNVGPQRRCVGARAEARDILNIRGSRRTRITFLTTACASATPNPTNDGDSDIGKQSSPVQRLEQVVLNTRIQHRCRGDLAIVLRSPAGTTSFLLKARQWDIANGTVAFSHLSLLHWGEDPRGHWVLDVADVGRCRGSVPNAITGVILEATLEFYGTSSASDAQTLNRDLFREYRDAIDLSVPEQGGGSRILETAEFGRLYRAQQVHFIGLGPLHKRADSMRQRIQLAKKSNSSVLLLDLRQQLLSLKTALPRSDFGYLSDLLASK